VIVDSHVLNHPAFVECLSRLGSGGGIALINLLVFQDPKLLESCSEEFISYFREKNILFPNNAVNVSIFLPENTDGFSIILKDGSIFSIDYIMLNYYQELFPAIYVEDELKKIVLWFLLNPKKRKLASDVELFIYKWLSSATSKIQRRHKRVSRTL